LRFADLYIKPKSTDEALNMIARARSMKIGLLGIDAGSIIDSDEVNRQASRLGVKIYYIYVVEGERRSEIARHVRRAPRNAIITVTPWSIDAARYAAVNKRVHIIRIPPGMERIVDRSTAKLFRDRGWGAVELVLRNLLSSWRDSEGWRHYYLAMRRAYAYGLNVVLSSGAEYQHEMWHPYQMAGIASLAGVPGEHALTWVSSTPSYIASLTNTDTAKS